MSENNNLTRVLNCIDNEGFDYCFDEYSDFKYVTDAHFHNLREAYLDSKDELYMYVINKANEENTKEYKTDMPWMLEKYFIPPILANNIKNKDNDNLDITIPYTLRNILKYSSKIMIKTSEDKYMLPELLAENLNLDKMLTYKSPQINMIVYKIINKFKFTQ